MTFHPVLVRQLRNLQLEPATPPDAAAWGSLLDRINRAYLDADQERYTLERSIAVSGDEMRELYVDLAHKHASLSANRQRIEAIFEHSAVGQALIDERGICTEANPALTAMLGCDRSELVGRELIELIDVSEREAFVAPLGELLAGKRQELAAEQPWRTKAGSLVWVNVTLSLVQSSGTQPRFATVFLQNVTERKRLEDERRDAQKLESVGRLAAGIAHEINTPVQFVSDNLPFLEEAAQLGVRLRLRLRELLQRAIASGCVQAAEVEAAERDADIEYLEAEVPRALAQTKDGVERIATIVRAMKEFSHPDGGEHVDADLNRALASTIIVARSEYKLVAEVQTEFGDIPVVPCNVGDLNQAFLNILVNAAHAIADVVGSTGQLGTIKVRTCVDGDWLLVSISDDGAGMPEHIQARIFEPFFTTKEVGKGTGQGLAMVRAVIVRHSGQLTFRSRVGKGTTFEIRLPIIPGDRQRASQELPLKRPSQRDHRIA